MKLSELTKRIQELQEKYPDDPEVVTFNCDRDEYNEVKFVSAHRQEGIFQYIELSPMVKQGNFIVLDIS